MSVAPGSLTCRSSLCHGGRRASGRLVPCLCGVAARSPGLGSCPLLGRASFRYDTRYSALAVPEALVDRISKFCIGYGLALTTGFRVHGTVQTGDMQSRA